MGGDAKTNGKGICFSCNEKYTLGHRCKSPQAFYIEGQQAEEDEIVVEEETKVDEGDKLLDVPKIFVHAVSGWSNPRAMRMVARVENQQVAVLVDSGSTHNFIRERIAKLLHLAITATEEFEVRVANGERLRCKERCGCQSFHSRARFSSNSICFTFDWVRCGFRYTMARAIGTRHMCLDESYNEFSSGLERIVC